MSSSQCHTGPASRVDLIAAGAVDLIVNWIRTSSGSDRSLGQIREELQNASQCARWTAHEHMSERRFAISSRKGRDDKVQVYLNRLSCRRTDFVCL